MRILREANVKSNSTTKLVQELVSVADRQPTCTIENPLSAWNAERPGNHRFNGIIGHMLSAPLDDINRDCPLVFGAISNTTIHIGTCVIKGCRASTLSAWTLLFYETGHVCIDDILKARDLNHLTCCDTLVSSARTNVPLGPLIVVWSSCAVMQKFDFTFRDYTLVAVVCGIDFEVEDSSHKGINEESIDSHLFRIFFVFHRLMIPVMKFGYNIPVRLFPLPFLADCFHCKQKNSFLAFWRWEWRRKFLNGKTLTDRFFRKALTKVLKKSQIDRLDLIYYNDIYEAFQAVSTRLWPPLFFFLLFK